MLEISLKSMTYPNGYLALKDIDLQFPATGLFMIVGESGSGKSTLMQCLSGMLEFDGKLVYGGKNIERNEFEDFRRDKVGYIFQDYKLFDRLSAIDNVVLGNQIVGRHVDKESAYQQLKDVGLEKVCNKKVKLLSGGEKQRVAIVRTVVKNTNIIAADEPTGNLDSKNSRVIMSLLKEISRSRLVFVITHNMKLAEEFGDRIIKLSDGRVVDDYNCTSDDKFVEESIELKPFDKESRSITKVQRIGARSFFQLAFLRSSGAKLIATTLLALVVCIIAIFATMIAGLNKINLAERYLAKQDGNFAITSHIYSNGGHAFIAETSDLNRSYYLQCEGWYIDLSHIQDDIDLEENDEVGEISYCLQLDDSFEGIQLLYGSYPQTSIEVCIPIDIAKLLSKEAFENAVGQTIKINTGRVFKEFIIKGVFESYVSNSLLSKSLIISSINEFLQASTAEKYVGNSFACKKGGIDIVIYNAEELGRNIAKDEILLSPLLYAATAAMFPDEISKGMFSFVFSYEQFDVNSNKLTMEYIDTEKSLLGVDTSLKSYSAVLNSDDYNELIDYIDIKYAGIVFDHNLQNVADIYKQFKTDENKSVCYISGNYKSQEFIDTVTTVEAINIKIMLPIALVFWIICILCMYIMLKNLIMANKKNLSIMKILGIKRKHYFAVNCISNIVHLITIAILAIVICVSLNAILSSLTFFFSTIFAFVGWEFLGLVLAMLITFSIAMIYLNKN